MHERAITVTPLSLQQTDHGAAERMDGLLKLG
jgi:hypothetical protein